MQDDEDESWYFVSAKKIKIASHKEGGKKTVIGHAECLKQIEMNREQTKSKGETSGLQLGKRLGSDIIYESRELESNNTT